MSVTSLLAPPVTTLPSSASNQAARIAPAATGVDAPAPDDLVLWRLSVEQYHAIVAAGILTDDDPVELLEGLLVDKMPKNPPHSAATQLLQEALSQILPVGWRVAVQDPITLADSEPEPDLIIVRGKARQYVERHPGPGDLAMVVEVSSATLRRDQASKKRMYAGANIPVYWIINLVENRIQVYTDPTGPAAKPDYRQQHNYLISDTIPVVIEGEEVARLPVQELLP